MIERSQCDDDGLRRQHLGLLYGVARALVCASTLEAAVRAAGALLEAATGVEWVALYQAPLGQVVFEGVGLGGVSASDGAPALLDPQESLLLACLAQPGEWVTGCLVGNGTRNRVWDCLGVALMPESGARAVLLLASRDVARFDEAWGGVWGAIAEMMTAALGWRGTGTGEGEGRLRVIRAQAAAEERETLLRQIVHDVRNATQAMSLLVEELEMRSDEPDALRQGFGKLHQQIDFIGRFLREKLEWIQSERQSLPGGSTPLREAFVDLDARYAAHARARQQRLVIEVPEPVAVLIRPVEFAQAMGNLLDNAIKYTETGGSITVRAECVAGWATIWVIDSGPGIAPTNRHRLGDLGWREHHGGEGSGVGLTNVREVVTQVGGLFGLARTGETGSSFYVSLPTTTWGQARHG